MAGSAADDAPVAAPPWPALLPWQVAAAHDALGRGRAAWPHALLLTGIPGIGKRTLALNFARALLCESPRPDGSACAACPSCGYVTAGQHPDLRMVEPFDIADDEVKVLDAIPVDHVRRLTEWTQVTSHRGVAKVALITPADLLNPTAANALLKTLEEPPAGTYLILVTARPGRLLPTVRSRCLRLPAPVPTADAAGAWLAGQGARDTDALLAQAGGGPLVALALQDLQQERSTWLTALGKPRSLSPVTLASRIEGSPKDERKALLALVIDWMAAWVADLARVAAGGTPARNPDHAAALGALAPTVAPVALFRYHRSLLEHRALVAHPLAPRLVAESLLIRYRELFR